MVQNINFVFFAYFLMEVAYSMDRPQIEVENNRIEYDASIQLTKNETLKLSCFANYPVKWVLPDNEQYQNYSNPENDGRLTAFFPTPNNATLILNGLMWTDTGFYRCVSAGESTDKKLTSINGKNENKFYLYVKDSDLNHLFLHFKGNNTSIKRHQDGYINCLVTDISANVSFKYVETKIKGNLEYVKRFGFKVLPNSTLPPFDHAICHAQCNDEFLHKSDSLSFMLTVHDPPVADFTVSLKTNERTLDTDLFYRTNNVTLICTANSQYKNCELETPKGQIVAKNRSIELPILDVNSSDSGIYKCSCNDTMYIAEFPTYTGFVEKKITVRDTKGQITFIKGNLVNTSIKENEKRKRFDANFKILMPQGYSFSDVTVRWFRSYSTIIQGDVKEEKIRDSDTFSIFTIPVDKRPFTENAEVQIGIILKNVTANLSGDYTLSITAIDDVVNITFNVTVNSKPMLKLLVTETRSKVELNSNYLEKDRTYYVWCIAEGLPKQNPILLFRPCITDNYGCAKKEWVKVTDDTFDKTATFQNALLANVSAPKSGTYRCMLDSEISNESNATMPFIITDIHDAQKNHGFNIEVIVQPQMSNVYQHSNVSLVCKTQIYDKYEIAQWYYQSLNDSDYSGPLQSENKAKYYTNYQFKTFTDEYSSKSVLTLNNIQMSQTGIYICQSFKMTNTSFARRSNATINVFKTVYPSIGNESSLVEEAFTYTKPGLIRCDARGEPFPKVEWMKDNVLLNNYTRNGISFEKDGTVLKISRVVAEDRGVYTCNVSNFAGQKTSLHFKRNVDGLIPDYLVAILVCASGLLGFFVLILLVVVVLQRRKHAQKLKKLQNIRQKLLEPCYKDIDKDAPIKEQVGSLSYPLQYEIPVRFVLPIHSPKDLLGSGEFGEVVLSFLHIPADNLAVAVKIIKSTLPVDQIIELLSEVKIMIYSGYHINVLPLIGAVTSCLGMNKLYVVTEFCKFGSLLDFVKNRRDSFINELITLNNQLRADNEHFSIPNGYLIPVLPRSLPDYHRSHSKGKADSKHLCTSDLLYFSYQIANGMEYLSNKKIIHRDLALRNILITENNLIRISDFGLSRHGSMYQLKKNKFKLPYQWMAYESLTDYSFSEKSDIWSFGIVLWEIFTLGEQPYHEYKNFNDLKNALKTNKRLRKPDYASVKMYNFMKRCWSLEPELRPTFTECKVILAEELNTFCAECHSKIEIILNDPKNQPDYSALQAKFVENSPQSNNGYEVPNSHIVAENMRNQSVEKIRNRYYQFPKTSDTENGQPLIRNETKV